MTSCLRIIRPVRIGNDTAIPVASQPASRNNSLRGRTAGTEGESHSDFSHCFVARGEQRYPSPITGEGRACALGRRYCHVARLFSGLKGVSCNRHGDGCPQCPTLQLPGTACFKLAGHFGDEFLPYFSLSGSKKLWYTHTFETYCEAKYLLHRYCFLCAVPIKLSQLTAKGGRPFSVLQEKEQYRVRKRSDGFENARPEVMCIPSSAIG